MEIPLGLETPSNHQIVSSLEKALYGLQQSPRAWFDRFSKTLVNYGYTQCQADHTLFVKFSSEKKIVVLIVYVDEIIPIGDYGDELLTLKKLLAKELEIKDLGPLIYFLGMEVA